jgi:hypothetical protein
MILDFSSLHNDIVTGRMDHLSDKEWAAKTSELALSGIRYIRKVLLLAGFAGAALTVIARRIAPDSPLVYLPIFLAPVVSWAGLLDKASAGYDKAIADMNSRREKCANAAEADREKQQEEAEKRAAEDKRKEEQRVRSLRNMNNTIIGSTSHDAPITRKCADGSVVPIGPHLNQGTTGVRVETRPIQDGKTSAPTIGAAWRDSEPPNHKSKKKRRGARWDRK